MRPSDPERTVRTGLVWAHWRMFAVAALTILYYAFVIYRMAAVPGWDIERLAGYLLSVTDGTLVVGEIVETDVDGQRTLGASAGLRKGDRILGFISPFGTERPIRGYADYSREISGIRESSPWGLVVRREEGGRIREVRIRFAPNPDVGKGYLWVLVLRDTVMPLIAVLTGLFIGFARPRDSNAFLACLLFLAFGFLFQQPEHNAFGPPVREFMILYRCTLWGFLFYLFALFFLRFPSPSAIDRRLPWLKHLFFAFTVGFWIAWTGQTLLLNWSLALYSRWSDWIMPFMERRNWGLLAMFLTGLASLALNTVQARSQDDRRRTVILLLGAFFGLVVPTLVFLYIVAGVAEGPAAIFLAGLTTLLLGLFPLSFVYAVVKHRVFGFRVILRKGIQHALISKGFLACEGIVLFLLLYFLALPGLLRYQIVENSGLLVVAGVLCTGGAVLGIQGINRRIMPVIDRRFFRENYDARRILADLGTAVRHLAGEPDLLARIVTEQIMASLHADHVALFLKGNVLRQLKHGSVPSEGGFYGLARLWRSSKKGSLAYAGFTPEMVFPSEGETLSRMTRNPEVGAPTIEVYAESPEGAMARLGPMQAAASDEAEREILASLGTRLLVPLALKDRVIGFLSLGEKRSEEPYSREDKDLLSAVAQQTAIALDYAGLIGEAASQARLRRDIEIATEVQQKLLPQNPPPMKTLDYAGACRPAQGVGGDYYDFLRVGEGRLGLAIADISGKGVSAALLMANIQAMLRSQASLQSLEVDRLVQSVNRLLCESTDSSKFATLFYGVYEEASRAFTYVNAGHNPPMVFRAPSEEEGGESLGPLLLSSTGMLLGVKPDAFFTKATVRLRPGDLLALYSDGVTEAFDAEGREFGEDRLAAVITDAMDLPAKKILDGILAEIQRFAGDTPQSDDITLVIARIL